MWRFREGDAGNACHARRDNWRSGENAACERRSLAIIFVDPLCKLAIFSLSFVPPKIKQKPNKISNLHVSQF